MFSSKVALIIGASSGIGAATAQSFAKEGASLAIVARNIEKLNEVADTCKRLGSNVLIIKADISKEDEANTIVKQTIEKFGKLDILINNAGIVRYAAITDGNLMKIYDEVMNTNLRPVVHLTHLAAPYLIETKGNIVNVSSIAGMKAFISGTSAYQISKAALDHFTRSAALELAPFGVRVNSINPGSVLTNIMASSNFSKEVVEGLSNLQELTTLGRISQPEEMADLILYMASEKAKCVTGSCYVADNGALLK